MLIGRVQLTRPLLNQSLGEKEWFRIVVSLPRKVDYCGKEVTTLVYKSIHNNW